MKNTKNIKFKLPEGLKKCIEFHGHLCPGLVYGYLVAKEAITLLKLKRSKDLPSVRTILVRLTLYR